MLAGASTAPASQKRLTDRQIAARAVLKPADIRARLDRRRPAAGDLVPRPDRRPRRAGGRPARAAARVTAKYTIGGADLVFVRAGRGISLGAFVDVISPFDEALRAELTATQVGRL